MRNLKELFKIMATNENGHSPTNGLNGKETRAFLGDIFVKGGGGAFAALAFMFGQNFLETQERVIIELNQIKQSLVRNDGERTAIDKRVDRAMKDIEAVQVRLNKLEENQ